MKWRLPNRGLFVLCLASAPFLGGADGGCSGGQVAIGGDGIPQECRDEEQAVRDAIAANKSCASDAECQSTTIGCGISEASCSGVVYTNRDIEDAGFEQKAAAFRTCAGGSDGCAVCTIGVPPAACVAGTCQAQGSGGSGNSGGSGGGPACGDEEQTVRDFIAANKACGVDADCTELGAGCGITEDGCTGAVYVNQATNTDAFQTLMIAFSSCANGSPGCAVCERTSAPPACVAGKCARKPASSEICSLPFEAGPCDAYFPVYAMINGACTPAVYGGCEGNANRFSTLEECMGTCEGRPGANPCPAGRVEREICLSCGPAGGCGASATVCALPCQLDGDCEEAGLGFGCWNGVCQVSACE